MPRPRPGVGCTMGPLAIVDRGALPAEGPIMKSRFLTGRLLIALIVIVSSMWTALASAQTPVLSAELQTSLQARGSDAAQQALAQATERAVKAGASDEMARSLVDHIDERGLPMATVAAWLENTARLGEEGLPLNTVLSFYVQGVAKGYPADRIEPVVAAVEHRLREAATLVDAMGPTSNVDSRRKVIDDVAWVLGLEGVSKDDVSRPITLAQDEDKPVDALHSPVLTFGTLIASGLPTEQSFDVVSAAWTKGYRGEPLERLGAALANANPSGGAPPQHLVNEVMQLLDRETSQDRFFQGLDELMGREGYRLPSIGTSDDPLGSRPRPGPGIKDPIRDNDKPAPGK